MAQIIDGKALAAEVKSEVAVRVKALAAVGVVPGLAAVIVGDDPASQVYVRMKRKTTEELGMFSTLDHLPSDTTHETVEALVNKLNADPTIHGILLQQPFPKHLDSDYFLSLTDPRKDVDGLHPTSQGLLMQGRPSFVSCTPAGVYEMLKRSGIDTRGANVVVVGRSVLVGKPLSVLLSGREANATVTLCHTGTRNLIDHTRRADILILAAGVRHMIGADHVTKDSVVIDVGTNANPDGSLTGDVDFAAVEPIVRAISPVPGGVGPMTRALLMQNTVLAAERSLEAS